MTDVEILKRRFAYNPDTGIVSWRDGPRAGRTAGTGQRGYIQICVSNCFLRAHNIAWLLMTGSFPPEGMEIDHINREKGDNRWCNLRLATRSQNKMNEVKRVDGAPVRGVSWDKRSEKWKLQIVKQGKPIYIGRYRTLHEAAVARQEAERRIFGDFAPIRSAA